jgi:hypothetical protein
MHRIGCSPAAVLRGVGFDDHLALSWRQQVVLLTDGSQQAYIDAYMRRVALFIPEELLAGLKALKIEHGTPEAESIRRAIAAYLGEKGVRVAQKRVPGAKKRK